MEESDGASDGASSRAEVVEASDRTKTSVSLRHVWSCKNTRVSSSSSSSSFFFFFFFFFLVLSSSSSDSLQLFLSAIFISYFYQLFLAHF
jgi:hypothetical protein